MATKTIVRTDTKDVGGEDERYNIIGYAEIPITDIEVHDFNPRPNFMLDVDDPEIVAMGESIAVDGQHNPALVYEKIDNYRGEDEPGKFRLYQGERRYRACRVAGVETLRCLIAAPPQSEAEEWDWLGSEEAFKRDWGAFFKFQYAVKLADAHNIPVFSQEVSSKTGIPMGDLKTAEKVFSLEPAIQAIVAEYEQLMYDQLVKGERPKGSRLVGSGVRSAEFPVTKAAAVYDLFAALRENTPALVKKYDDLELQRILASKATEKGATLDELQKLHGQIKQLGGANPPPGLLKEISDLLTNDERTIGQTIKNAGVEQAEKLNRFASRSPRLRKLMESMIVDVDQLSNDTEHIDEINNEVLSLIRVASELERALSAKQKSLLKAQLKAQG